MGIPVFLLFVAINAYILLRFVSAIFRGTYDSQSGLLAMLALVAYLSFASYAFMSLFLESPYHSARYWIVLGVMHHLDSTLHTPESRSRKTGSSAVHSSSESSGETTPPTRSG